MKTTVFLFHPNLATSRVNRALVAGLSSDIEVRDLYQLYPDFKIDVAAEQQVLAKSDRIVWQFPLYWYSSPALLKQWQDLVLTHGWAYGTGGEALHQKELVLAVSPGSDNYGRAGFVKYQVTELLRPFQATSRLIGTKFMKPFITLGASTITTPDLAKQAQAYNDYLHQEKLPLLGDFD
ncbi:NADPH-quinone reductase [Ligilactobacillus agilis]|uniref:NADPH-quinone reductase n=1 Tax=Ligilactobacillus agilis TaxID=1601 RepID=A0A6F9XLQ2_9LACO|nr:NAD(P)H-dependent oxidoreductase [Ligilactobacillus agilis]GET06203.1 NADPH-quinone reductase [Ligilactobacillus agilis]